MTNNPYSEDAFFDFMENTSTFPKYAMRDDIQLTNILSQALVCVQFCFVFICKQFLRKFMITSSLKIKQNS